MNNADQNNSLRLITATTDNGQKERVLIAPSPALPVRQRRNLKRERMERHKLNYAMQQLKARTN